MVIKGGKVENSDSENGKVSDYTSDMKMANSDISVINRMNEVLFC